MLDFSTMLEIFVSNADLAAAVSRGVSLGVCERSGPCCTGAQSHRTAGEARSEESLAAVGFLSPRRLGALIAYRTALENETYVKVIDPKKLEILESVGRSVREACT